MPYQVRSNSNEPLLQQPGQPEPMRDACNDKLFAIIFCVQALAAIAFAGWSAYKLGDNWDFDDDEDFEHTIHRYGVVAVFVVVASLAMGIISAVLWFQVVHHRVKTVIYTSFLIQLAVLIYLCTKSSGFIIPLILVGVYFFVIRRSIPLAAFLIETGITVLFENTGMISFSLQMVTLQGILTVLWLVLTVSATYAITKWGVFIAYIVSTYWVGSVVSNMLHFSICHVVGGWFLGDDHRTLWQGMRRASWQSFGSIALGSLIVTVTHVLHMLVRSCRRERNGRNRDNCALCLLGCLTSYLERIAEWVNVYAIAYVALSGMDFLKSASGVWRLFKTKGFSMVINDDLVHIVLALGPIVVATVVALVCTVVLNVFWTVEEGPETAIIACSFLITFWVNLVLGQVLHSIVITLYICYLDNTTQFKRFHPLICNNVTKRLVEAYPSYRPPPDVNPEWSRLHQQQGESDYVASV